MKKKITSAISYLFFLGIGVFLVWWSLQAIPADKWDDFILSFRTANFWLLIPVFLILSGSHIFRALRWKMLLEPMGYKPKLPNTFFAVMIGYLANLAVPRLGEVLKCTLLSKYEKIPVEKLVGTIVIERAIDVVCLATVFLLAFIVQNSVFVQAYEHVKTMMQFQPSEHNDLLGNIFKYALLALVIIAIIYFIVSGKYKQLIIKIVSIAKGVVEGLVSVKNMQNKVSFIGYTIGIWVMYILGTWIGLSATQGSAGLGITTAISALAFASIGMIVTPGGIGSYAILLAKVLEFNGIDYQIGYANGTLQWFAQFLIVVCVGFISLSLLPWYNKKTVQ